MIANASHARALAPARQIAPLARTAITRVTLTRFRNYAFLHLALDDRNVVLTGHNGAGKTNILEALSLLSPGRGLRGQPYSALPRHGGDGGWAVAVRGHAGAEDFALGTGSAPGASQGGRPQRAIRVDGAPARSSRALAEKLRLVWLTPAMDGLFTGPAADRRKFLDRLTLNADPSFAIPAAAFDRAMRQRNRALEDFAGPLLLDGLEQQMAEAAIAMAFQRVAAIAALASQGEAQSGSAFPWFALALDGDLESRSADMAAGELEDWYAAHLREGRERDRAARRTLIGPHRSDLLVTHGPKNMGAALCSTGEQKALLLGLVLAQCRLVKAMNRGVAPLILLDEVAAHLDSMRRSALFAEIVALGAQAWLTGTDRAVFAPLEEVGTAQFFVVSEGSARPAEGEDSPHNP
jgi:DNA replication and repair protein RecF